MTSLYARYVDEKTDDFIIEKEYGFATYRFIHPNKCYIIDLYILPEYRKNALASKFADKICEEAKAKGCTELIGTVIPSNYGSTESIQILIAYGMKVAESSNNLIIFKKDI